MEPSMTPKSELNAWLGMLSEAREKATPGEWGTYPVSDPPENQNRIPAKVWTTLVPGRGSDYLFETTFRYGMATDAAFIALAANEFPRMVQAMKVMSDALVSISSPDYPDHATPECWMKKTLLAVADVAATDTHTAREALAKVAALVNPDPKGRKT
jgi:hypothetical protein